MKFVTSFLLSWFPDYERARRQVLAANPSGCATEILNASFVVGMIVKGLLVLEGFPT